MQKIQEFDDSLLSEPNHIIEIENPVKLSVIEGKDDIFFNDRYTSERRVRTYIYNLLLEAKQYLPSDYYFMIYEAFRPKSAQIALWDKVVIEKSQELPNLDTNSQEFIDICNVFVANPHKQGSGHQSGAAVDVSLVNGQKKEYDMGGIVRGFGKEALTNCSSINAEAKKNREILYRALSQVGLVNYPSEWWHYSFGDRLWARLTGSNIAIFANLEQD